MRFMFGQALAGAARRGSQRLQELETRAQTITDRATERFLTNMKSGKHNMMQINVHILKRIKN